MIQFDADKIKMVLLKPEGSLNGIYPHSKIIWKMLDALNSRNGFNRWDKPFLQSVAIASKKYKNLTPKQAAAVGKSLVKYTAQLVSIANEVQPEKAPPPSKKPAEKDAPKQLAFKVIRSLSFED